MLLVVGLGNIGQEYQNTYHNMGFMAIDVLAETLSVECKKAECMALTALKQVNGEKIVLAKPTTYMNLSGSAVKGLMAKYGALAEEIIIIYDDIDIERFTLRARAEGSAGTHNGMRHIVQTLARQDIKRIRVGVGKELGELKNYVLSQIKKEDQVAFRATFFKIAEGLTEYIKTRDFERLQRELNQK